MDDIISLVYNQENDNLPASQLKAINVILWLRKTQMQNIAVTCKYAEVIYFLHLGRLSINCTIHSLISFPVE